MSISETITRNDLTNILNEVLTAGSGMTVEDISDKITFGDAWSNYMRKAYLIGGKFVFFTLEGYAGTIMAGTQYTIATIASGYRPKDNLAFTGHATDANYLPQSTVNCYIWTSGDITIRCSNGNGSYVFISGWYALAEGSAPVIVADYIVEQGTSDIWTYRKWNSGIAECWTYIEGNTNSDGGWHINPTLPSFFNSTQVIVNVNYWSSGYTTTSAGYTRTNISGSTWSIDAYMYNGAPNAMAGAYVSAKGRWK